MLGLVSKALEGSILYTMNDTSYKVTLVLRRLRQLCNVSRSTFVKTLII